MKWLLLAGVLGGCGWFDEHGKGGGPTPQADAPGTFPHPVDAKDPLCGTLICGPDRHCEAQCQAAGTAGCANECHVGCVPNTPCSEVDCGAGMACIDTAVNDCFGMAWFTSQRCEATTSTICEALTESACMTRSDCAPIYRGEGCSCAQELCSCGNPHGDYVRCRPV